MKYISVDALQAFCDNQIDHSITPNDFQRMNQIEIVRCKDCKYRGEIECPMTESAEDGTLIDHLDSEWYCADGEWKDGDGDV